MRQSSSRHQSKPSISARPLSSSRSKRVLNVFNRKVSIKTGDDIRLLIGSMRNASKDAGGIACAKSMQNSDGGESGGNGLGGSGKRREGVRKGVGKGAGKGRTKSLMEAEKKFLENLEWFRDIHQKGTLDQMTMQDVFTKMSPKPVFIYLSKVPSLGKKKSSAPILTTKLGQTKEKQKASIGEMKRKETNYLQGLKANLHAYNISDYLRQKIVGILESDSKTPRLNKLEIQNCKGSDSFTNEVVQLTDRKTPNALNQDFDTCTWSNPMASPRIGKTSISDSMFQKSIEAKVVKNSKFEVDPSFNLVQEKSIFPFVIQKPILTGDIAFSEHTFRSVLLEPDSNQKGATLEFTPASTIRQQQSGSHTDFISPDGRENFRLLSMATGKEHPNKRFEIKLSESVRNCAEEEGSMKNRYGQVNAQREAAENEERDGFLKKKGHIMIDNTFNDGVGSMGSACQLKMVRREMVDQSTQTSHQCCKSVAVQVNGSFHEMSDYRKDRTGGPRKNYEKLKIDHLQDSITEYDRSSESSDLREHLNKSPNYDQTRAVRASNQNNSPSILDQRDHNYFQFRGPNFTPVTKRPLVKSGSLNDSPTKKPAELNSSNSKGSPNSNQRKPQIKYDPSKVILAKVSTFRSPMSLKAVGLGKFQSCAQPELINFSDKDLLASSEKLSPEDIYKKKSVTNFTSAYTPTLVGGRVQISSQMNPCSFNLIQFKKINPNPKDSRTNPN